MGMIDRVFGLLFGRGNVIAQTAEVFRPNAENAAQRELHLSEAALAQMAAEFANHKCGLFDSVLDAINRLPRPALAMGTLGLFVSAMVDPVWFGSRMQGLALVPEPLWWLLGAIVSFYFGARHQAKGQDFQRSIALTLARAPVVAANLRTLDESRQNDARSDRTLPYDQTSQGAAPGAQPQNRTPQPGMAAANAALADWRVGNG